MQMPDTYYSQDVLAMITLIWGAHAGVGGWCQSWPAQDLRWDFLSAQWQTLLPCRCGVHSQVARAEPLVVRLEMALFLFKCVSCWQASTQVLLTVESRLFQPFSLSHWFTKQPSGLASSTEDPRTMIPSPWLHLLTFQGECPPTLLPSSSSVLPRGRGLSSVFLPILPNYVRIFLAALAVQLFCQFPVSARIFLHVDVFFMCFQGQVNFTSFYSTSLIPLSNATFETNIKNCFLLQS